MDKIIGKLKIFAVCIGLLLPMVAYCAGDSDLPQVAPTAFQDNIAMARQGDAAACRTVADCYLVGVGVKKDVNEAWKWYARAAGRRCAGKV